MKYLKNNCWQFLLFAALSCLMIWKALLLPNCFAFDANDERNHTFVNLKAAKDILLQGEFPFMNFYNNFGTPLIGDGLTFPFSPLALTHYLLPGYLSMTINRGVTFFFVLLVAFYFFSTFFPKRIATFVSVLVVFQPAFLWHAAHHHYQLSLGLFLLFMICLVKVYQGALNNREFYGAMFVLSIMLLLSVSMNIVVLILFYLLICAFILLWNNNRRIFLTMGAAIAAGLLCTGFEIVLFFENFSRAVGRRIFIPNNFS